MTKTAQNASNGTYYVYFDVEPDENGVLKNKTIPSNLPANLKAVLTDAGKDPADYGYVRWYVTGTAAGNQPYTMTLTDTAADEYGAVMLGMEKSQQGYPSADGKSATMTLLEDDYKPKAGEFAQVYQNAFVWMAYPLTEFNPSETYTLHNTAEISVTSSDDGETTTKTKAATVKVKMPGIYTFTKLWNDNDNDKGTRPQYLPITIYRDGKKWKTVNVKPVTNAEGEEEWKYTWSDEGVEHTYQVYEQKKGRKITEGATPSEHILTGTDGSKTLYDENGNPYTYSWGYRLEKAEHDPETNSWTYTNKREEYGKPVHYETHKKATNYTDSSASSTKDRAVNNLLDGKSVTVDFLVDSVVGRSVNNNAHELQIIVTDDDWTLANRRLSTEDVSYDYVIPTAPQTYNFVSSGLLFGHYETLANGYADAEIQILRDGNWETAATLTAHDDGSFDLAAVESTGASIDAANARKLLLPEGVEQVRMVSTTQEKQISVEFNIGMTVQPTQTVQDIITARAELSDYVMLPLWNHAKMTSTYDGQPLKESEGDATAYLHGRMYRVASYLTKKFTQQSVEDGATEIPLKVELTAAEQSNIPALADYRVAIEEGIIPYVASGTFYDLLPLGVTADLDSISLGEGDELLDAYTIENWHGSGCTLVVIRVKFADHSRTVSASQVTAQNAADGIGKPQGFPKDGVRNSQTVSFMSYYPLELVDLSLGVDAVAQTMETLNNVAAFENDADKIGNLIG